MELETIEAAAAFEKENRRGKEVHADSAGAFVKPTSTVMIPSSTGVDICSRYIVYIYAVYVYCTYVFIAALYNSVCGMT